jgi:hypothetical protein
MLIRLEYYVQVSSHHVQVFVSVRGIWVRYVGSLFWPSRCSCNVYDVRRHTYASAGADVTQITSVVRGLARWEGSAWSDRSLIGGRAKGKPLAHQRFVLMRGEVRRHACPVDAARCEGERFKRRHAAAAL